MPLLGCEIASNTPVTLGDIERRSSLYVLGKPGTGKSTLLKSLLLQDMQQKSSNTLLRFSEPPEYIIDPETKKKLFLDKHFLIKLAGIRENLFGSQQGVSDFFLDPHGETIDQIIKALPVNIDCEKIKLLDPANNDYAFGINPLSCPDITSFTARQETFNKTYTIFKRLWEKDAHWGVWLRLILENMLPLLIETNYTLAEGNLFLTNKKFRFHVLQQIKYNTRLVTFWQNEFKEEQAQAAITRISSLLSRDYVAHILGQKKTTLSFDHYVNYPGYFILRKLPPTLDDESRHFIGTIIVSELQHAIMSRKDIKHTFCLYLDEFQLFATDEFAKFISEGRKFGCSTTLAHQEREGQFGENEKILGATMACANKVIFQCTVKDARELAPEFAEKPTATETRMIPELVISKDPMWDLLRKGHPNKKIQDMGYSFFIQFPDNIRFLRDRMEEEGFIRMAFQDQATVYRDVASIYGTQEREEGIWRGIDIGQSRQAGNRSDALSINTETIHAMEGMLAKVLGQHGLAREQIEKLKRISAYLIRERDNIIIMSMFLTGLMEGDEKPEPGKEEFA
jgi:hypothetical protein